MKVPAAVVTLSLVLVWSSPALAWDPLRDQAVAERPGRAPAADPVPYAAPPPGVYYVTDTYVGDVVTTVGALTTYATTTVHESTGSWARVLETVGTGGLSIFDGTAFNGRRTLTDGRPVAGTYYENFVLTDSGFVPVSVVFFQDDAELARLTSEARDPLHPLPEGISITSAATTTNAATTPSGSLPCCDASRPTQLFAPDNPTPNVRPARPVRPVLSLHPASGPLTRIEVIRGRQVTLWLRAFVDEHEVPVRAWSVESGNAGDAFALSGAGAVPFRTAWRTLAPAGSAYEIVFRLDVDTPETGLRTVHGSIVVTVRSPALEQ
jgi:hypothetical protein